MQQKKRLSIILLLFPLLFTSCNRSKSLWNRTFVSNKKTFVNWSDKVSDNVNISKEQFLINNFGDIDWTTSGFYYYNSSKLEVNPFITYNFELYEYMYLSFSNFKNTINNFWSIDKDGGDYDTFYGIKKSVDKSTFTVSLDSNNRGTLTISFNGYDGTPLKDVYSLIDETESKDGSELSLYKGSEHLYVGYITIGRYSNKVDFIRIRSGYTDETAIDFRINFNSPHEGLDHVDIYNAIIIKDKTLPVWAIVLISVGSTAVVGVAAFFIVKKVKQKKRLKNK